MTKIQTIKLFICVFLGIDILLILISLYIGGFWLLNTQIAYFCSIIIFIGAYIGYTKMINTRVANYVQNTNDEKDLLDKIDDPYDLYGESEIDSDAITNNKQTNKSKKEKIKTNLNNAKKSIHGLFSPYRLFGYALIIIACVSLMKFGLFAPIAFFVGISLALVCTFVFSFIVLKKSYKDS